MSIFVGVVFQRGGIRERDREGLTGQARAKALAFEQLLDGRFPQRLSRDAAEHHARVRNDVWSTCRFKPSDAIAKSQTPRGRSLLERGAQRRPWAQAA